MDFLRKHYEKVLLSVVLLGLAVAAAYMPFKVSQVEEFLAKVEQDVTIRTKPKLFKPLDLTTNEQVLQKLSNPLNLRLTGTNNLFNSVRWMRRADGTLTKVASGREIGPAGVTITKITPLNLILSYEGPSSSGDSLRYQFNVTQEAHKSAVKRRSTSIYATLESKNDVFRLKEIKVPKEDPTGFVIVLLEDNSEVPINKGKQFTRVAGYMADLKYDLENITFPNGLRKGDSIKIGPETYNIVAITERDVTLSAKSNSKNTTIHWNAAP